MAPALDLPVVDLAVLLDAKDRSSPEVVKACKEVATCLYENGVLVVRDPRVPAADCDRFMDVLERYYAQPKEVKMKDARPEIFYQVGVTPEGTEVPSCKFDPDCHEAIKQQPEENRATVPTKADPKWRWMWRVGERPKETKFAELNVAPPIPEGFPEWRETMDGWGEKLVNAALTVAEMAARGFDLPPDTFTTRMHQAPHLCAPTGTDLEAHGELSNTMAGYHYDLNFLTIHGKSRYPGLFVWLRNGKRVPLKMPDGCLLMQAGKQLEWLTGGHVKAGYHEVVVTPETIAVRDAAAAAGRCQWRVSSTVFAHIASDVLLKPLGPLPVAAEAAEKYPEIYCGEYVKNELEGISLKRKLGQDGQDKLPKKLAF